MQSVETVIGRLRYLQILFQRLDLFEKDRLLFGNSFFGISFSLSNKPTPFSPHSTDIFFH